MKIHLISLCLPIALGVVHTSMTPVFNQEFSADAMWFAVAGPAMGFCT
jgi:hypothetical protein